MNGSIVARSACGHLNSPGQRFCGECGERVTFTASGCPNGHSNPDGQKFCGECGTQLAGGSSPATAPEQDLDEVLGVTLIGKTWQPALPDYGTFSDQLALKFEFENRSTRTIRAFTGRLFFFDLFGRERLDFSLTVDRTPMQAGARRVDDSWSFELNQFMEEHNWVAVHELHDMSTVFVVQAVIFADGSQLGMAF